METQKTRMKQKKSEKQGFEKRSPLQNLNGLQFDKSIGKKSSNLSSSKAPNGCLRFLPSSNSCSDATLAPSSSSSSSRTHLDRKLKSLSRVTNNVSAKSSAVALNATPRSKENEVPRKPFSEKSKKNQQPCPDKRQYGKTNTKPTYKTAQRSKLCCGQVKVLKNGSEQLEERLKSSHGNSSVQLPIKQFGLSTDRNFDSTERCTPAGKIADSMSFDDCKNVREDSVSKTASGNSATVVKTPPVEASVSPEIPCGSHSKLLVLKSAATPVCYGAGHLLSGVTDKRKCRRRGSLRGGGEKVNLFDDEESDGNVISISWDSSIPLLAEASVRWLSSPCDEGREDQGSDSEIRLDQCKSSRDSASLVLDLLSSPSTLSGNVSDLRGEKSNYSGSDSVGDAANQRKSRIITLSPQKDPEVQCFLGHSNKKMHEPLLVATPNSVSSGEGINVRHNVTENNSAFSLGSLSSGNIIQTPNSDSSSYGCVGVSNVEAHHKNFIQFELDSITETLNDVSMSPRSQMSMRVAPSLSFQCADLDSSSGSIIPIHLQKNVDSVCSWLSDSASENLALSQTKISWRDGLVCKIDENDDLDCCPCLSDGDIDAVGCSDKQLTSYPPSQSGGDNENDLGNNSCPRSHLRIESWENEDNFAKMDLHVSPILLEYEPCISSARRKEKTSEDGLNACAESICTDGVDLAASCDSDWAYLQENHMFQAK